MAAGRSHPRRPGRSWRDPRGHGRRNDLAPRVARPAAAPLPLIWGRRPVLEALRAGGRVRRVLVARGTTGAAADVRAQAALAGVLVRMVERTELDALVVRATHQGVAAYLAPWEDPTLDDLLANGRPGAGPALILAADEVQDVGNLGALARTLEAVGGTGLVVPTRRSASLTGDLARASAGASLRLPIVAVTNLVRALEDLKARGVWVIGLDAAGPTDFDTLDYNVPCCLVVGGEAEGLRRLVRATCDHVVRVPMRGAIGSLNVAVAGALVLYQAARTRPDWMAHGRA